MADDPTGPTPSRPTEHDSPTAPMRPSDTGTSFGPLSPADPSILSSAPPAEQPGDQIGPYKLRRVIGEGGFGMVWLAEQLEPVRRQVALKVIKPGMDSRAVIARFEAERQALAVMDHPSVAKVFDAGTTPREMGSRPYFVMEYVKGEPITRYCDRHKLSTRQRLDLFIPVCEAIQHAHSKGVIHRDIKPSNILVRPGDPGQGGGSEEGTGLAGATPKVIDFGIAKAISHTAASATIFTDIGMIIGTPEYMSPEQAEGSPDIDTRTDVYSLGIVLYELLAGALPFDPRALREAGYHEIRRIIREVEPPKPSTRLSGLGESGTKVASDHGTSVAALSKVLRAELEWIPLKAIEKSRARRYRTATELADDIRNYLAGRPLIAGPASEWYRLKKLARKHKGPVLAGLAIAASLAIGLGLTSWYAVKLAAANRKVTIALTEAKSQRETAEAINTFLNDDLLGAADPDRDGPDVKVVFLLDRAAATVVAAFKNRPAVEAGVCRTLGQAYLRIGKPESARTQLQSAKDLLEKLGNADPRTLAELSLMIAETYWRQREAERAIAVLQPLLADLDTRFGADDPLSLDARNELAGAYKWADRIDEAQTQYMQVLQSRRRVLGDTHEDTIMTRYNLALIPIARAKALEKTGDDPGAAALRQSALEPMLAARDDLLKALGPNHSRTFTPRSEVAALLIRLNRYDEAEAEYDALLPAMRKELGESHWRLWETTANFGSLYMRQQKFQQAAAQFSTALDGYHAVRGKTFRDTIAVTNFLAGALEKLNQVPAAAEVMARAYDDLIAEAETERAKTQADKLRALFERAGDPANTDLWRKRAVGQPP